MLSLTCLSFWKINFFLMLVIAYCKLNHQRYFDPAWEPLVTTWGQRLQVELQFELIQMI